MTRNDYDTYEAEMLEAGWTLDEIEAMWQKHEVRPLEDDEIIEPGDKVTYIPTGDKGIVKRIPENSSWVFVVFGSHLTLENYQDYTAQAVKPSDLKQG